MASTGPHPLDRTSGTPLWAQVEDDLRRRLAGGAFTDRFPTDRELVDEYGVSRHTAREAVRRLRADGVLKRHRGRGSFVNSEALEQPLGGLYSLFRTVEAQGLAQRSEVLALDVRRDPGAAAALGEPPRSDLVHLARIRYAGEEPLAVDRAWLPAGLARPLLDADFTRTALYDELGRRCGILLSGGTERIQPTHPDADDAARLGVDIATPVFAIERRGHTTERVVEFRRTIIRGDRYAFVAEWGADAASSLRATASDP
jgi:GntR family transcriptional regulator